MAFFQATASSSISRFKQRLQSRLKALAEEAGRSEFVMPVGLFLLIDEDNGGDMTAQELVNRFHLLDFESKNIFHLSDKLGLAIAKKSLLDWFLEKWGSLIGAKKLQAVAIRNLGPEVPLSDLG